MIIIKRRPLSVALLLLLTVSVGLLFLSLGNSSEGDKKVPRVKLFPEDLTDVAVGEVFSVYIEVEDVEDLYGFDFVFVWNNKFVEYVDHKVMVPVEDWENGVLHGPVLLVKDDLNSTLGVYRLVCASVSPADAFDGAGTLVVITFKLKSPTEKRPYDIVNVELSDNKGQPMLNCENQVSGFVVSDSVWEFIRKRAKDPMVDGWLRWWRTQLRRKYGV